MMKIAVLGTRGIPNVMGGIESHCEHLYPYLAESGCEVTVFTRKPYVDSAIKSYKGITLIPLGCVRNKYLEAFLHTFMGVFATKRIKPDIVHIHAIGPSLFIPLARCLGMKVVMTNHGPDYQREKWGKLAKFVLQLGERLGSKWAHGLICISQPIADDIKGKYNREATVLPNGVRIPQIAETEDVLKQYDLVKGKYILSVGRLVPEKGFHHLIDAFNALPPNSWKLVIVGRTHVEDKYSVDLKEKGSKNPRIVFTGFLTGKPLHELYSHAGLFILPSSYEGLPIALLEAMSYGLSCIASDIPGSRNVGLDDDRYFEPGNSEQVTSKMIQFIRNPLSSDEREKQIRVIAENYDWAKIAERTLEVYKKILGLPLVQGL